MASFSTQARFLPTASRRFSSCKALSITVWTKAKQVNRLKQERTQTCTNEFSRSAKYMINVLQHAWVLRRSCEAPWSSIWQLPTCRRNSVDRNLTIAKVVGSLTFQVRSSNGYVNNTLPMLESSLSLFLLWMPEDTIQVFSILCYTYKSWWSNQSLSNFQDRRR